MMNFHRFGILFSVDNDFNPEEWRLLMDITNSPTEAIRNKTGQPDGSFGFSRGFSHQSYMEVSINGGSPNGQMVGYNGKSY